MLAEAVRYLKVDMVELGKAGTGEAQVDKVRIGRVGMGELVVLGLAAELWRGIPPYRVYMPYNYYSPAADVKRSAVAGLNSCLYLVGIWRTTS